MNNALTHWTEPGTVEEARTFAKMASASTFARAMGVTRPEDAFVIIASGAELGLTPMQSLRNIYVVKGRPTLSAAMMAGLCKRSAVCKYFRLVESTIESATFETLRADEPEPTRITYTMADAKRAGLLGSDAWKKHPAQMLRARAQSGLARVCYPEVVAGLYDPNEMEPEIVARVPGPDIIDAEVIEPSQVTAADVEHVKQLLAEAPNQPYIVAQPFAIEPSEPAWVTAGKERDTPRESYKWLPHCDKSGWAKKWHAMNGGLQTFAELYDYLMSGGSWPGSFGAEKTLDVLNALRALYKKPTLDVLPVPEVEVVPDDPAEHDDGAELVKEAQDAAKAALDALKEKRRAATDPDLWQKKFSRLANRDAKACIRAAELTLVDVLKLSPNHKAARESITIPLMAEMAKLPGQEAKPGLVAKVAAEYVQQCMAKEVAR